jgi:hypothetical protein
MLVRMHTCIPAGPCGVPFVRIKVRMSKRIADLAKVTPYCDWTSLISEAFIVAISATSEKLLACLDEHLTKERMRC